MADVVDYSIFDPAVVLAKTVVALQTNADLVYANDLKTFSVSKDNWIQANTRNRDMGLPIAPFVQAIPKRVVFSVVNGQITETSVQDPSITPPVLPSVVVQTTPQGWSTSAPQADAANQSIMITILNTVLAIQKQLATKA